MDAERLVRALGRVEDGILVLLLGGMLALATLQILLRNGWGLGLVWVDPLLRVLVLWLGLVGAMVAARADRHLSVDVFSRRLGPRARAGVRLATDTFTAMVCGLLAWHGARFVSLDLTAGTTALGRLPAWILEAIIPVAFLVIGLRYLAMAWQRRRELWPRGTPAARP